MSKEIILKCRNLVKRYGDLDVDVLKGVNLEITVGERVAIMGASGSGKSTLLHLLGGLDKATSGEVMLNGVNLNTVNSGKLAKLRNQSLGFIYQSHHLLGEFTVLENVAMPLVYAGIGKRERLRRAEQALHEVGLGDRLHHTPAQLSGGQQQRVALARALVSHPDILLLDIVMPRLDGFGVIEALRANPQTRDLPIIVISAKDLTGSEASRLKETVAVVMKKQGFQGEKLIEEIKSLL